MEEIWKPVKNNPNYEVSSFGRVKSIARTVVYSDGRVFSYPSVVLKTQTDCNGYVRVSIGNKKALKVHRLVAEAFLENNQSFPEVNHIDGNKQNNNVNNLEWVSRSNNMYHRYRILGQKSGMYGKTRAKCPNSKKIIMIQNNNVTVWDCILDASEQTGISNTAISNALRGKSKTAGGYRWKYIK